MATSGDREKHAKATAKLKKVTQERGEVGGRPEGGSNGFKGVPVPRMVL